MFKSKLNKLDGLTYKKINNNIIKAIKYIIVDSYINIFKGCYCRSDIYVKKSKPRIKKLKNYLE
jgi:hypothetical protein